METDLSRTHSVTMPEVEDVGLKVLETTFPQPYKKNVFPARDAVTTGTRKRSSLHCSGPTHRCRQKD